MNDRVNRALDGARERGLPLATAADLESSQLLTVKQAAALLAVCERTVFALTADGRLPCVRLGRAKRYRLSDVRAFLEDLAAGD